MTVRERLETRADSKNADFVARLTPGISRESILGVRLPVMRGIARDLRGTHEEEVFLASLPHETMDENTLHALMLSGLKDYEKLLPALHAFLPYVDNWLTCDALRPSAVKKHRADFEKRIGQYLESGHPYTVRFGIEMLMSYYLDEAFMPSQLERVAGLRSEHYYVRMMQAWYFATALAKQYESTVPILETKKLDRWTHNKTIQKAVESYRISIDRKNYLKSLKEK